MFICSYFVSSFSFVFFNFFVSRVKIVFDWESFIFLGVLFCIVGSILFFGSIYMSSEVIRVKSFFLVVFSFVFFMVCLILAGDWFVLIVGWDWLGVSSFFLVCFYHREKGWVGRLKTYFYNRLGDGFFLFVISFLVFNFFFDSFSVKKLLVFMVILLCQTKRAQIPFSSWLPAAMSAPTPVSALVHSSTLVTAGVYILIRCGPFLTVWLQYIQFVGLLTLFLGRFCACGRFDAKKIVAFSTLSHLGYMFIGVSSGFPLLRFFHLVVHASFKALMFIRVGMLIVENNHSQDFRHMGVSFNNIFFVWVVVISGLRLMGFPFFSGFFSKDFILESFLHIKNLVFFLFFFLSLTFSAFYTFRLIMSLVKIKWCSVSIAQGDKKFFYMIFLLFLSVFCGKIFRYSIKNVLLPGCPPIKVVIYFSLFLGALLYKISFFGFFSNRINSLDSFSNFLKKEHFLILTLSQNLDQGVVNYVREYPVLRNFSYYGWIFSKNLFYLFWLFCFLCFFW